MKKKLFILFSILGLIFILSSCAKKNYTLKMLYEDGSVYKEVVDVEGTNVNLPELTKEGHEFLGWFKNDVKVESIELLENTEVYAKFEVNKYTYKFYVGEDLYFEETLEYNSTINYPSNPEKEGNAEYSYEFTGWDNNVTTLKKDEVFNATFKEVKNTYTYTFFDEFGNEILSETKEYGSTITYPSALSKEETDEFKYEFIGWSSNDEVLTSNIEFRPVFEKITKEYTYKFVLDNGDVILEKTVPYGTMPIVPTDVSKESDGSFIYEFVGWDKNIEKVTKDVVYTAVFEKRELSLDGMKLSIMGDSISTFYEPGSVMNSYYSGTNTYYYPTYSATIKTVDLTWWYQLIVNTKMNLGINNSWSGSCASGSIPSAGVNDSRINTLNENGKSDIVIIYLGTNDLASGVSTEVFMDAINTIVSKVKALGVKHIFVTTLGYTNYTGNNYSEEVRLEYNEEIRKYVEKENLGLIPLDEYVINDNYMIYLGDYLHYNAKGAKLLSKIAEKSIKEYFGIEFNEEIEVEHKELLPEGVLGYATATADSNFWGKYATDVFFATSSFTNPQFSTRIEIKKSSDGYYYVSRILKSGELETYDCDYVLVISDSHENKGAILLDLENVVAGSIVEFDESLTLPLKLTFKEGNEIITPTPDPEPEEPENKVEGQLHIGAYNTGVWTLYETTVMAYSHDAIDKSSTFINFSVIKITKVDEEGTYKIVDLKPVGEKLDFAECDYYILIFSSLEEQSYYDNALIEREVVVHGDITTGNANIEFK